MPKLSLNPGFIRDSISVFRQRGIKGLVFGTTASLEGPQAELLAQLENDFRSFQKQGARKGSFTKIDAIHKGKGTVYLTLNPDNPKSSLVLFSANTQITNGPDLWVYLSDSANPKQHLGNYQNLGLVKGNKGAQAYKVNNPLKELGQYKSVIIHCKQFDVLFSYALLS